MKKIKIGDVFKIDLSNNKKAFGQYIFADKLEGPIIQIFDLILDQEETIELSEITSRSLLFPPIITGVFSAIKSGYWEIIGNQPIENFIYPKFISTLWDQKTGKARIWFLWDGKNETKIGWSLPENFKKYEYRVVWSPFDVVERIEKGGEILNPYKDLIEKNQFTPKG